MNLARLDILILLQIDTRCSLDKRTSKWYGYYTKKWFFTQVHSPVILFHSNQRQSAMKSMHAEEERSCMKKFAWWSKEPFPGKSDYPLSQFTPGTGPVSRGPGSIGTYKGERS
jgi:hypothetical protein